MTAKLILALLAAAAAAACKPRDQAASQLREAAVAPVMPAASLIGRAVAIGPGTVSDQTCLTGGALQSATDAASADAFDAPLALPSEALVWVETGIEPAYYGPAPERGEKGEAFITEPQTSLLKVADELDANRFRGVPRFRTGAFVASIVQATARLDIAVRDGYTALLILRRRMEGAQIVLRAAVDAAQAATRPLGDAAVFGACGDAFVTAQASYSTLFVLAHSPAQDSLKKALAALSRSGIGKVDDLKADQDILADADGRGLKIWLYEPSGNESKFNEADNLSALRRTLVEWSNDELPLDRTVRTTIVRVRPYATYAADAPLVTAAGYDPVQLTAVGIGALTTLDAMSRAATGDDARDYGRQAAALAAAVTECDGRRFNAKCQRLARILALPDIAEPSDPLAGLATSVSAVPADGVRCPDGTTLMTSGALVAAATTRLSPKSNLLMQLEKLPRIPSGQAAAPGGDAGPGWRPDSFFVWGAETQAGGALQLVRIDALPYNIARYPGEPPLLRAVPFQLPAAAASTTRAHVICIGKRPAPTQP